MEGTLRAPKLITGATLLAFLMLVFFGILNCTNPVMRSRMNMEGVHSSMADCIPGKNCGMDMSRHIQIWQEMITSNVNAGFSDFFASLLLAIFILATYKVLSTQIPSLKFQYRYYERDHRESRLYSYFVHIFSIGILQPKLFAS